ncbi:ABC transporter substrate-binding protein [Rhizobium lusitanum]|uniref:Lactose/L-arabinose transport system substrate-binding protein n=1 Tax=Rhizobium lusitanum TaxID=293958 RepID=A0A7X0IWV6_9HYPH|nr:sugar ABC transporter substrate-binding protein [Rhizobium lusitanum]MBB6488670.1 lactose/L-arabinose transport system substrate-binding protein [Rhizobium lusitanum]
MAMSLQGKVTRRTFGKAAIALAATMTWTSIGWAQDLSGEISVWTWKTPGEGLKAAVPAFNKKYPNVKVTIEDVGNPAIWDKITTGMAAGGIGLPDIMNIGIDYMGNYVETFPDGLVDLNALGAKDLAGKFPTGVWASGSGADGKVYGIPYEANTAGFFYRKDLFDKAGIDISKIETWDDMLKAGVTLKQQTGVPMFGTDKAATRQEASNLWQLLAAQQGSFFFDAKGDIAMNDAAGVRALTIMKQANDAGIMADIPGGWDSTIKQVKGEIGVAVLPVASWMAGVIRAQAPDMKGKWAVRRPPAVESGGLTAAVTGATYLSINAQSANKDAAWAFINFALGTLEGQKLVYGGGGLFPGYKPLIESADFVAPDPYYDGEKVNQLFVDELAQKTPAINFTGDYAQALKAYMDAQTQVLLKGADPKQALDAAATLVAGQTGRKIKQ